MKTTLSTDQLLRLRIRSQQLWLRSAGDVAEVVRASGGLQAQDEAAGLLSVRARSNKLTAADVTAALMADRTIARTWLMRGTLHFVATADLRWMLALLGPIFSRRSATRRAQLGLDDALCDRATAAICEAISRDGPQTRPQIAALLSALAIPSAGQATIHLIGRAAMESAICQGADRDSEQTFVLLDSLPEHANKIAPEDAPAELARIYVGAFGPATANDFATWSGLAAGMVKAAWDAIGGELLRVDAAGSATWMLRSCAAWLDELDTAQSVVRLLPAFDTYLLGYRGRSLVLAKEHEQFVLRGGIIGASLMIDGRIAGTWRSKRGRKALTVQVTPFSALPDDLLPALEAEALDAGHFLELPSTLEVLPPTGG